MSPVYTRREEGGNRSRAPRAHRTTARPLRDRYCAPGLASSLTEGGLRRGETARAPPARTGQRPARCATATAPRFGLLPHRGRIEEGGTARAAPARTGQRPARRATATAPRLGLLPHGGRIEEGGNRSRGPRADRTTARPLRDRYCAPGLSSSLTERGLRRGKPLARPPRGQDNRPPAARPRFGLLPHGRRIEEGGTARAAPARTGQRPAR